MVFTGPTIVDRLESHLGGLDPRKALAMSRDDLDKLAEVVVDFYEMWTPDPEVDGLLAYSGDSIGMASSDGEPELNSLRASLLYYPTIAVHCPFAAYFTRDRARLTIPSGPRLRPGELWAETVEYRLSRDYFTPGLDLESNRIAVRNMLTILSAIRPLVQKGAVLLVPPWKIVKERQHQIEAAIRADVGDDTFVELVRNPDFAVRTQDGLYAGPVSFETPRPLSEKAGRLLVAEAPSFYQNKLIAIADELHAVYIPTSSNEYEMLAPRIGQLRRELRMKSRLDFEIVRDIMSTNLPLFSNATPEKLVEIRQNESAFEEFRQVLATTYRSVRATSDPNFPEELSEAVKDALAPRVAEVRRATSTSTALRAALREGSAQLVIGGVGTVVAVSSGAPILPAAIPTVLSGISAGLYGMLVRPKLDGANVVISALSSR